MHNSRWSVVSPQAGKWMQSSNDALDAVTQRSEVDGGGALRCAWDGTCLWSTLAKVGPLQTEWVLSLCVSTAR